MHLPMAVPATIEPALQAELVAPLQRKIRGIEGR
jgi:hypothetical protein